MRIKVLDVLSFVLLINRQFYEVRVLVGGGTPGSVGSRCVCELCGHCESPGCALDCVAGFLKSTFASLLLLESFCCPEPAAWPVLSLETSEGP